MTSSSSDGNLGGQAGADTTCATLASGAGLSGTFKAWLSTSTTNAKDKLGGARGFVRTDGQPFADQVSDITSGKLLNVIDVDENGNPSAVEVWTGTLTDGTASVDACGDFTSSSSASEIGFSNRGPQEWTDFEALPCNFPLNLYCFDTSHTTPLTVTPSAGRIAFVSKAAFDTSSGLAGADTLCANEAAGASLSGTFQALLSTGSIGASSRAGFDFSAQSEPYVRPDGIKIADAPAIGLGGALDSGIWQNADGAYASGNPWTGSTSPLMIGASNCANWTTNSASFMGSVGDVSRTNSGWWNSTLAFFCNDSRSVYCLEE